MFLRISNITNYVGILMTFREGIVAYPASVLNCAKNCRKIGTDLRKFHYLWRIVS
jgi:hypothetical protein